MPHVPRVARPREALLPPPLAALVRRAGQAGIARDRFSISQLARQYLIDEHVRCLDADANNACKQANHRMRAFLRRSSLFDPLQTLLLNFFDLVPDDTQSRNVAAQFRVRIRR